MLDPFNRKVNYLRISVTDRCNLRCTYCVPEEGMKLLDKSEILSLEQIFDIVKIGVANGITKVRLTGGEPLIRKDILELVSRIASLKEIKDLGMTTNAILLDKYAEDLVKAGLNRINISLDTMSPEKFKKLTRGGDINQVFKGIKAAQKAGLQPIKINCVVFKNKNEKDAREVANFCRKNNLFIRYIHQMDLKTGEFSVVEGGEGGDCKTCNRLRLLANGDIKPCLFSDIAYNVNSIGTLNAFKEAMINKPKSGTKNLSGKFYGIGG